MNSRHLNIVLRCISKHLLQDHRNFRLNKHRHCNLIITCLFEEKIQVRQSTESSLTANQCSNYLKFDCSNYPRRITSVRQPSSRNNMARVLGYDAIPHIHLLLQITCSLSFTECVFIGYTSLMFSTSSDYSAWYLAY